MFINGYDAYDKWGIIVTTTTVSELMTPAGQKALVSNKSRLEDGKRVITRNPRKEDREVTLNIQMVAKTKEQFLANYSSFCEELAKGRLEIWTAYQAHKENGVIVPDVIYRMDYISCSQYSEFMFGIGRYTLRLNEPDPTDRGVTSKH